MRASDSRVKEGDQEEPRNPKRLATFLPASWIVSRVGRDEISRRPDCEALCLHVFKPGFADELNLWPQLSLP